jgi:hypothetical protein
MMTQVGPLRECPGPDVVYTDVSSSVSSPAPFAMMVCTTMSAIWLFYLYLKTVAELAIFYSGGYLIKLLYHSI